MLKQKRDIIYKSNTQGSELMAKKAIEVFFSPSFNEDKAAEPPPN